jgi:methyltransferase (TIGR00027 family)
VRGVSDTALLTAEMRAVESRRPDALFIDPFAAGLAGDEASQIAPIRRRLVSPGGVIARTAALDNEILRLVDDHHIELVVNIGAGLDTRPLRLALPSGLRWIEIDMPGIIQYKADKLAGEPARCRLERHAVDLRNRTARREVLDQVLDGPSSLIVCEGVLPYLRPADVAELAAELGDHQGVKFWWFDLVSPTGLRWGNRFGGRKLAAADATGKFAPETGADFFRPLGWDPVEVRSLWLEQRRIGREPKPMRLAWTLASARLRGVLEQIGSLVLLRRSSDVLLPTDSQISS